MIQLSTGVEDRANANETSSYEELAQKVVVQNMKQILGESGAQATFYLLRRHGIDTSNIVGRAEAFEREMKLIFKDGWAVFEKVFMASLSKERSLRLPERSDQTFVEQLSFVRKHYHIGLKASQEVKAGLGLYSSRTKYDGQNPLERGLADLGTRVVGLI